MDKQQDDKFAKYKVPGPIKIYPTYLDAKLKYSEGRKVSKASSCENPLIEEIGNICVGFGLEAKLEGSVIYIYNKYYRNIIQKTS